MRSLRTPFTSSALPGIPTKIHIRLFQLWEAPPTHSGNRNAAWLAGSNKLWVALVLGVNYDLLERCQGGALASCQVLYLQDNQIGDDGMKALAEACRAKGALPQLENVNLFENPGNEELVRSALRERKGSK